MTEKTAPKAPELWRYRIPNIDGEGWAIFVIGSDGYFSSVSDWGNYAFIWRDHGCKDFREFLLLAEKDWQYFSEKLAHGRVYDGVQTEKLIKETIIQQRRDKTLSKAEAHKEWKLFTTSEFGGEFGFHTWYLDTELGDAGELACFEVCPQTVQFVRKAMVRLIPLLKAELEALNAVG